VRRPDASAGFSDEAISLLDLLPLTLAWATGRSSPPRPAASRISMPSVVALPHQCDRPWRGIRTANRKLILSNDRPWLFFDLATDPDELRNLADDPGRAAEIAELRRTSGL
jgi:arylsulfatase A-like enzyme